MSEQDRERDAAVQQRRRMAAIFGDPLPDRTRDELSEGGEDAGRSRGHDEWLRSQVPPHHG